MAKCTTCGRFLSPNGVASCMSCSKRYHKDCAGIPNQSSPPNDWVCKDCTRKQRRGDSGAKPVKGSCVPHLLAPSTESRTPSTPSLGDPDISDRGLRRELAEYMAEQREFRAELRASIASMATRMDGFERRLEALERIQPIQVTPENNQVEELQQTITQLKLDLNRRDQEALQTDLNIEQLPEEKGENLLSILTLVAAKLGVTLQDRDIIFAERAGAPVIEAAADGGGQRRERPRRVVVRLARRDLRDQLLRAARARRNLNTADIGLACQPRRLYLNERLTKSNRELFYRVRMECTKRQWRFSWTKRGCIYVRQGEGRQAHPIRSVQDIKRIFGEDTI